MKKIISLAVAMLMVLGSLAMTACDFGDVTVNIGDTQTETTAVDSSDNSSSADSGAAAQAVRVDSVNGMKAPELIEKYFGLYNLKTPFEASATRSETVDGKQVNSDMVMKVGVNSIYIKYNSVEGVAMNAEMWVVNNTMYMNQDGQKAKTSGVTVEDLAADLLGDMGELPAEKIQNAELYQLGNTYYFAVELSPEESEDWGYDAETHTLTFYFDAKGNIAKVTTARLGFNETETYSNVGGNVVINPPADADSYISVGESDGGLDDVSDAYKTYLAVFERIERAETYVMDVYSDDELIMEYSIDTEGDQYMMTSSEGSFYHMWVVGKKAYVAINDEKPQETAYTSQFEETFQSARAIKSYMNGMKVMESDMTDLRMEYLSNEMVYEIQFCVEQANGEVDTCFVTFDKDMTAIAIELIYEYPDGDVESVCYAFYEIDNCYMDVYV